VENRRDLPVALVVDDEPQILRLVKHYLSGEGFHVITAQSRAKAEQAVERAGSIDVLITDIFLGDGWGGELAFTLQEMHSKIPVVFISGRAGEDPILRHGIQDHMVFLEKPFSLVELTEAVQKAIDGVSES
jgi:DNA-binding NtrC family response regulator